jgi:hypothetical protein
MCCLRPHLLFFVNLNAQTCDAGPVHCWRTHCPRFFFFFFFFFFPTNLNMLTCDAEASTSLEDTSFEVYFLFFFASIHLKVHACAAGTLAHDWDSQVHRKQGNTPQPSLVLP